MTRAFTLLCLLGIPSIAVAESRSCELPRAFHVFVAAHHAQGNVRCDLKVVGDMLDSACTLVKPDNGTLVTSVHSTGVARACRDGAVDLVGSGFVLSLVDGAARVLEAPAPATASPARFAPQRQSWETLAADGTAPSVPPPVATPPSKYPPPSRYGPPPTPPSPSPARSPTASAPPMQLQPPVAPPQLQPAAPPTPRPAPAATPNGLIVGDRSSPPASRVARQPDDAAPEGQPYDGPLPLCQEPIWHTEPYMRGKCPLGCTGYKNIFNGGFINVDWEMSFINGNVGGIWIRVDNGRRNPVRVCFTAVSIGRGGIEGRSGTSSRPVVVDAEARSESVLDGAVNVRLTNHNTPSDVGLQLDNFQIYEQQSGRGWVRLR